MCTREDATLSDFGTHATFLLSTNPKEAVGDTAMSPSLGNQQLYKMSGDWKVKLRHDIDGHLEESIPPNEADRVSVESSPQDDRQYRVLTLPSNHLTCLLISDPNTDKASAAMDVRVGHLSDPEEAPGLAHFLEHMLFLGTEKFPDENDYSVFLSSHGGHSNAYTDAESTNYYFDVQASFLEGALDRFAQFFISPLFTHSSTEREMNAVDSEHSKNVPNDYWRTDQLHKSLSRKDHAYHKFGTGNIQTLKVEPQKMGLDVRAMLLKFHDTFYSANVMKLVVLGKESLDELESMVNQYFSSISNKNISPPQFPGSPFAPQDLGKILSVVPVREAVRTVDLLFPLRETFSLYRTKPARYISHLLGHEGKGSILSLLKKMGWATALSAGEGRTCSDWSSFHVTVDLTESGLDHVHQVIHVVFTYIAMLKEKGVQTWIYEETSTVANCNFRFLSKKNPSDYTSTCAHNMQIYPVEFVLSGPYLLYEYDPALIQSFIEEFHPGNVLVTLSSKTFEGQTTRKEFWYGTDYSIESIPEHLAVLWNESKESEFMQYLDFPEKNEMIPVDFTLNQCADLPKDEPVLILETNRCRLWYKPDNVFDMPKVNVMTLIQSSVVSESPEASVLSMLWVEIVQDHLNEFSYLASMAGLHCSVSETRTGIQLSLSGYSEKAHILYKRVIETMLDSPNQIHLDLFARVQDMIRKKLKNFLFSQPYQHAIYASDLILEFGKWTTEDMLLALDNITLEAVTDFARRLMKRFHLEILVHGNISPRNARDNFASVILNTLEPLSPWRCTIPEFRVVQLPKTDQFHLRFKEPNQNSTNSSVEVIYQIGAMELHANALLAFLNHLMKEPSFDELRTKEQLGYIVHTSIKTSGLNIKSLIVLVQSDCYDPIYVLGRIDAFVARFREKIVSMNEEEFQANIEAVASAFLEKNKNLSQETGKYWQVISDRSYQFKKWQNIASCVTNIQKNEVIQFYDKHIAPYAPSLKKLCILVYSQKHMETFNDSTIDENVKTIYESDIGNFRESLPLFSLPESVRLDVRPGLFDDN